MRKPVNGTSAGRLAFSLASDARILRGAMFDVCNACAVRSSAKSWKVKRCSFRAPRLGVTNPALISPDSTVRDSPSFS